MSKDVHQNSQAINSKELYETSNTLNSFPRKLPKRTAPIHSEDVPASSSDPLKTSLKNVFKFASFRSELQEKACRATCGDDSDVFVCMPTGAGELFCGTVVFPTPR